MSSVQGPTILLAAKVKAGLDDTEDDKDKALVKTTYGTFYVGAIVLMYGDGDISEIVGFMTPDEAEGGTFDFYPVGDKFPRKLLRKWLDETEMYVSKAD